MKGPEYRSRCLEGGVLQRFWARFSHDDHPMVILGPFSDETLVIMYAWLGDLHVYYWAGPVRQILGLDIISTVIHPVSSSNFRCAQEKLVGKTHDIHLVPSSCSHKSSRSKSAGSARRFTRHGNLVCSTKELLDWRERDAAGKRPPRLHSAIIGNEIAAVDGSASSAALCCSLPPDDLHCPTLSTTTTSLPLPGAPGFHTIMYPRPDRHWRHCDETWEGIGWTRMQTVDLVLCEISSRLSCSRSTPTTCRPCARARCRRRCPRRCRTRSSG